MKKEDRKWLEVAKKRVSVADLRSLMKMVMIIHIQVIKGVAK